MFFRFRVAVERILESGSRKAWRKPSMETSDIFIQQVADGCSRSSGFAMSLALTTATACFADTAWSRQYSGYLFSTIRRASIDKSLTARGIWIAHKFSFCHARILGCPRRSLNSPLSPVTCAATAMPSCSLTVWRTSSNGALDGSDEDSSLRIPNSPRYRSSCPTSVSGG